MPFIIYWFFFSCKLFLNGKLVMISNLIFNEMPLSVAACVQLTPGATDIDVWLKSASKWNHLVVAGSIPTTSQ